MDNLLQVTLYVVGTIHTQTRQTDCQTDRLITE